MVTDKRTDRQNPSQSITCGKLITNHTKNAVVVCGVLVREQNRVWRVLCSVYHHDNAEDQELPYMARGCDIGKL